MKACDVPHQSMHPAEIAELSRRAGRQLSKEEAYSMLRRDMNCEAALYDAAKAALPDKVFAGLQFISVDMGLTISQVIVRSLTETSQRGFVE